MIEIITINALTISEANKLVKRIGNFGYRARIYPTSIRPFSSSYKVEVEINIGSLTTRKDQDNGKR